MWAIINSGPVTNDNQEWPNAVGGQKWTCKTNNAHTLNPLHFPLLPSACRRSCKYYSQGIRRGSGEPLATLCSIWPAWELNQRLPALIAMFLTTTTTSSWLCSYLYTVNPKENLSKLDNHIFVRSGLHVSFIRSFWDSFCRRETTNGISYSKQTAMSLEMKGSFMLDTVEMYNIQNYSRKFTPA